MDIAGEPRSVAEMEFVAAMYPCDGCGDHRPVAWKVGGEGEQWVLRATCPRCATPREVRFYSARDLLATRAPRLELGGPEPSAVLVPAELQAELDRIVPLVAADPRALDGDAWHENAALVDRVRTALRELAKFVGPDGDIPFGDRTDQLLRPERYTGAWIAGEQARWDAVADDLAADAPRIFAADPMLTRGTPARGHVDPPALAAHAAWVARGKTGAGRLDVVISEADGLDAEGAELTAARLEAVRLRGASLSLARLDDAELVDCELSGAALDAATLAGARLRGCTLDEAELDSATLDRARLAGCSFARASLVRTRWHAAVAEGCTLRGAHFLHAQLDGARFTGCDLRETSFGALAAGAIFDRCDLRGADLSGADLTDAQLVYCRVGGAFGTPASVAGLRVVFADFSEAGDSTDLGDLEDLLDALAD